MIKIKFYISPKRPEIMATKSEMDSAWDNFADKLQEANFSFINPLERNESNTEGVIGFQDRGKPNCHIFIIFTEEQKVHQSIQDFVKAFNSVEYLRDKFDIQEMPLIYKLDAYILGKIFGYLNLTDLMCVSLVSKYFANIMASVDLAWSGTGFNNFNNFKSSHPRFNSLYAAGNESRVLSCLFERPSTAMVEFFNVAKKYCTYEELREHYYSTREVISYCGANILRAIYPEAIIRDIVLNSKTFVELLKMGFDQRLLSYSGGYTSNNRNYVKEIYENRDSFFKLWSEFNIADTRFYLTTSNRLKMKYIQSVYITYNKEIYDLLRDGISTDAISMVLSIYADPEHSDTMKSIIEKMRLNLSGMMELSAEMVHYYSLKSVVLRIRGIAKKVIEQAPDLDTIISEYDHQIVQRHESFFSPSRFSSKDQPYGPYSDYACFPGDLVTEASIIRSYRAS